MTDRDTTPRSGVLPEGVSAEEDARNRANQEAARRPGVDANNTLDQSEHMTATPHEGSAYQPMREGSDEQRQLEEDSDYVLDQGAGPDDGAGVSRRGAERTHGDERRESEPGPDGGSVFQPLSDDSRNLEDPADKQRGNPAGQNQQGLNDDSPVEQLGERRQEDGTRGSPDQNTRRS